MIMNQTHKRYNGITMKLFLFNALLLLLSNYAFCQGIFPPSKVKMKLEAVEITGNLKIDGKLDEPEWLLAKPLHDFIQMDPNQGELAKNKTVVRLLYNKDFLYISAVCYDTVGKNKYRVLNFQRDFSSTNTDYFAFAIDGYNDERNSVMFSMNPYGAQRDLLSFDDNYYDVDWDGLWVVRTQRTDSAWTAEVAIPWKTLRYKNKSDSLQTWGISFGRLARSNNEFSGWPAFPRAYGPLRMTYAGKLDSINAPKPATNIRIQPYGLYSYNKTIENSKTVSSSSIVKPGGDLKWAVNSNTLLDITANTDFAQADVDLQVNNINRFSVFFPERRQFFLENSGLFTVGIDPLYGQSDYSTRIQPFFSRAIGLDAKGNPLNIDAGARLVYRSETTNIGGLFIRQEGNNTTNPADFFVGRYSQNFGSQNRIGVLVSYKGEDTKDNVAGTKNLTTTVDGFFRFSQGLSWKFMGSETNDLIDHSGYAGASQLYYNSNSLIAWWTQSFVNNQYDPKVGFVARGNSIVSDPGFLLQERGKWLPKFIRTFAPGISFTMYNSASTLKLTDRYISINPISFQLQNGGFISWSVVVTRQNLDSAFTPLGVNINKGSYNYIRHQVSVGTDPSKTFSLSLLGDLGQYYNGSFNSLTAAVSFAPVPYFFISPNIEFGKLKDVGSYLTSKDVTLYSVTGRVALNPRIQLSGIYQQYSVTNSASWNARFSWEFQPLSFFYIVLNTNNDVTQTVKTVNKQFITKISYLRQF